MKIRIYSLASAGTDDDGLRAHLFATKAEQHARMVEIMEKDLDGDITQDGEDVLELIQAGEIDEAWNQWLCFCNPEDSWSEDEHDLDVTIPLMTGPEAEVVALRKIAELVAHVIDTTNPDHKAFLDSGADSIQLLLDKEDAIRHVIKLAPSTGIMEMLTDEELSAALNLNIEDWCEDVWGGNTKLGYTEWLEHEAEAKGMSLYKPISPPAVSGGR